MFNRKLNNNEKEFITILKKIMQQINGELELNCINGKWYAMNYKEDIKCASPVEVSVCNQPLITTEIAKNKNINIIKCCNNCDVFYVA